MSSWPGGYLEDYLMWDFDLIVDDDNGANPSLQIAESMGTPTRRIRITKEQFAPIVALYEPYREDMERMLNWFEDDSMSWRDYASNVSERAPQEVHDKALEMRKALAQLGAPKKAAD